MEKHKSIGKSMPELSKKSKMNESNKIRAEGRISQSLQNKRKVIQVHRNADEYSRSVTVLLTPWEQKDMELVLRAVGERVTLCNNKSIQRLYTLEGKRVKSPDDLEDNKVYVAAANDHFVACKYGHQLPHLVLSSKLDRRKYEDVKFLYSSPPPNSTVTKEKPVRESPRHHSSSSQLLENGNRESRKNIVETKKKTKPPVTVRARSEDRVPTVTRSFSQKPTQKSTTKRASAPKEPAKNGSRPDMTQARPVKKPPSVVAKLKEKADIQLHESSLPKSDSNEQIINHEVQETATEEFHSPTIQQESHEVTAEVMVDKNDTPVNGHPEDLSEIHVNEDTVDENEDEAVVNTEFHESELDHEHEQMDEEEIPEPHIAVCPPYQPDSLEEGEVMSQHPDE